jgi:hypothetical protein
MFPVIGTIKPIATASALARTVLIATGASISSDGRRISALASAHRWGRTLFGKER